MNVIVPLLRGVGITCAVAGSIGLFLTAFNIPFVNTFLLSIVFQFIAFYFYGEYIRRKNNKIKLEAEIKLEQEKSQQFTNVTCPCDRQIQSTIPININSDNSYMCPGCQKNISVYIETKTALATTPLVINPLEAPLIAEEVNKILNKNAIQ